MKNKMNECYISLPNCYSWYFYKISKHSIGISLYFSFSLDVGLGIVIIIIIILVGIYGMSVLKNYRNRKFQSYSYLYLE